MKGHSSKLVSLISLAISFLLAKSAFAHLSNPYQHLDAFMSYRIIPDLMAPLVAGVLPFLHVAIAVELLRNAGERRSALGMSAALFGCYSLGQILAYLRGMEIPCGCFGAETSPIGATSISIAVSAFVGSFLAFRLARGEGAGTRVSSRPAISAAPHSADLAEVNQR